MKISGYVAALVITLAGAQAASAACVNRFLVRTQRPIQIVTLLTGKLTFQEAQALAAAIQKKESPPLEWLGADLKPVARQMGALKVVRPMPVGCDGKPSGAIVIVQFASNVAPSKRMIVKLNAETTVAFDEQAGE